MRRFDFEAFDRTLDAALLEQGQADEERRRWEGYDTPDDIRREAGVQLKETLKEAVKHNALPAFEAEQVYFDFIRNHGLAVDTAHDADTV